MTQAVLTPIVPATVPCEAPSLSPLPADPRARTPTRPAQPVDWPTPLDVPAGGSPLGPPWADDSLVELVKAQSTRPPLEVETSPSKQAAPAAGMPAERQAQVLRETLLPATLAAVAGVADVGGWQRYVDDYCSSSCRTDDPIERLLVEQIVLTHIRITEVQGSASATRSFEGMRILNVAAARLLAEFRKLTLSLLRYREGLAGADGDKPTKTRQQNGPGQNGRDTN